MSAVTQERIAQAAKLTEIPVPLLTALVYTYDEAHDRYSEGERKSAAYHILWSKGDPRGCDPGSFMASLLVTWGRADNGNQARLALGFPVYADAFNVFLNEGSNALARWGGLTATPEQEARVA